MRPAIAYLRMSTAEQGKSGQHAQSEIRVQAYEFTSEPILSALISGKQKVQMS
jgi:DNA invertase Pin-like site-specific DNA recombinase